MMLFASSCSSSNGNSNPAVTEYAAVVSFGSVCCGPVSDEFLKSFVKTYNNDQKVNISADIAAGCGREGEFAILFKLDNQNEKHLNFLSELKKTVADADAKNRAGNNSSGTLEVKTDIKATDFEYCRLGIKSWM